MDEKFTHLVAVTSPLEAIMKRFGASQPQSNPSRDGLVGLDPSEHEPKLNERDAASWPSGLVMTIQSSVLSGERIVCCADDAYLETQDLVVYRESEIGHLLRSKPTADQVRSIHAIKREFAPATISDSWRQEDYAT